MADNSTTPKPTYVDRLDLHEIPQSKMPREPLNSEFSGKLRPYPSSLEPNQSTTNSTTGWIGPNFSKEMVLKWGMLIGFFLGGAAATLLWKIIL